jgi:hypothetical protein
MVQQIACYSGLYAHSQSEQPRMQSHKTTPSAILSQRQVSICRRIQATATGELLHCERPAELSTPHFQHACVSGTLKVDQGPCGHICN